MLLHIGTQTLETERLILRRFMYSDADDMLENWIADEKVQSMYSEPVYQSKDEVIQLLSQYRNHYEKNDYYRWAIILKENEKCIGQIAFFLVDSKNHFSEIEYCIGNKFQCKGLATEAAREVISFGFHKMNLNKIQICHKSNNLPSKRVIEKCGFTYEGTLREYFYMNGGYVDRLYYSILRKEYDNL